MLNPAVASAKIKDDYIGYLTTMFEFSDKEYAGKFEEALRAEGTMVKGPYLELNDCFEKGMSLSGLIEEGVASPLFRELEPHINADSKKEIPLERTLWAHQETAIRKARAGENLVVTTGTGSGKTECFLLPILNQLLSEVAAGTLDSAVRAILVYPMNALANDQMERLRSILNEYPAIRFGVFNGDTKETQQAGVEQYRKLHRDPDTDEPIDPLPNEVVSREVMRLEPPHIIITNYAMLEYMLLRPNDSAVFDTADLKFLVLDEAHTYRGATGIETSLLLRRLKARLRSTEDTVHILTSATLGDEDSDEDIVEFASTLCDAAFDPSGIIRSRTVPADLPDEAHDYPLALFDALAHPGKPFNEILADFGVEDQPELPIREVLFNICGSSALYRLLREVATSPMTIHEVALAISETTPVEDQDVVNLVSISAFAQKGKMPLVKARYHLFVKDLEGAFTALAEDKPLSLLRKTELHTESGERRAFELCLCSECGRYGIVGKESHSHLEFSENYGDPKLAMFVPENQGEEWDVFEPEGEDVPFAGDIAEEDYLICPQCGEIHHESNRCDFKCGHETSSLVKIRRARVTPSGRHACPSCGQGYLRKVYTGYDAVTSVLGSSLYESLPEREHLLSRAKVDTGNVFASFAEPASAQEVAKSRQFIAFSDSRSQAAFYASNLGEEYDKFLRRRGLWHVIQANRQSLAQEPWDVERLVDALTALFDDKRSFAPIDSPASMVLTDISRRQAWIAVLDEMVNFNRNSSLSSLGAITFLFKGNLELPWGNIAQSTGYDENALRGLFERLIANILKFGAIDTSGLGITDVDREYIFYTATPKKIVKMRGAADKGRSHIAGWLPTRRSSGGRFMNSQLMLTMKALSIDEDAAESLLGDYWDAFLEKGRHPLKITNGEGSFSVKEFVVTTSSEERPVFECDKCGKRTMTNCNELCARVKCDGHLRPCEPWAAGSGNHYARLYSDSPMSPLHIKEHTAQLGRGNQQAYQDLFIKKKLNALSCSTTFEMGVDVGDLEAAFLRNMPPTPANYVQRVGRTGRSSETAAFSLTFAKLGSHDFTFYEDPKQMIAGQIGVPVLSITNEKVILRHLYAVVLSSFFAANDDVYNGNNAHVLLNSDGYERLVSYLEGRPAELLSALRKSLPQAAQERVGVDDWGWVSSLIGDDGILSIAVREHRELVEWCHSEAEEASARGDHIRAGAMQNREKEIRRAPEDNRGTNQLIEFLVRNNILPKYGFPVDVVELRQNTVSRDENAVQLMRDLQLAVAEYAPGAQVVADGNMYTSRYIRTMPQGSGDGWDEVFIAECPNESCRTWNYRHVEPGEGEECIACQQPIAKGRWHKAVEPRKGFVAEQKVVPARKKPEHSFRSDDFYIGDPQKQVIETRAFDVEGGGRLYMESSANDSLLVVCNDDFFVCPRCGYSLSMGDAKSASSFSFGKPWMEKSHDTTWGKKCGCRKLQKRKLCHSFKTDVLRLTFDSPFAKSLYTMTSVMYALLEGASEALRIERSDIKGCLHRIRLASGMVYEVVIYDAVGGGAGHARRLVDDSCTALKKVIGAAIARLEACDCDPSCYSCLRNYSNRMMHDKLDRQAALCFLRRWSGRAIPAPAEKGEPVKPGAGQDQGEACAALGDELRVLQPETGFDGWRDFICSVPTETTAFFEDLIEMDVPPVTGTYVEVVAGPGDKCVVRAICAWDLQRILVFSKGESVDVPGWKSVDIDEVTPLKLSRMLKKGV
ncbi:MAG: DEAD/DEAH box helicase [Coriobacteriales bacterium]